MACRTRPGFAVGPARVAPDHPDHAVVGGDGQNEVFEALPELTRQVVADGVEATRDRGVDVHVDVGPLGVNCRRRRLGLRHQCAPTKLSMHSPT